MTCKDKGYEVGQVFKRTRSGTFDKESIMILTRDDNSESPFFDLLKGSTASPVKGEVLPEGGYGCLDYCKRIYPPEKEESNKVEITCEGKVVEISRESAKALKLI